MNEGMNEGMNELLLAQLDQQQPSLPFPRSLTQLGLSTAALYSHVYVQLWLGALGMALVVCFPNSGPCLWTGVIVYGFFNGPTIGYM